MIQLNNATYRIGDCELVKEVEFNVRPGEFVAIVGANGAGKTTTLRLLSGEIEPTAGGATLDASKLTELSSESLALRRAVLPQQSSLTFDFSVIEVVMLGRIPHATRLSENGEIAIQAMEMAGIEHLATRRYPTLSGGEKQRVHLARVLSQIWDEPDSGARYLLLDEPTSSLDLSHQHEVLQLARSCANSGIGVVAILHDLNLASQYADRISVLKKGKIIAEGNPREVLTPTIIQDAFDIQVMVVEHPCDSCPLVVPTVGVSTAPGQGSNKGESLDYMDLLPTIQ